ncbi:MAG: UDP-N-acetylmuramate--L-alanine ligase, partial [Patescibacteria group bacterium]
MNLKNIKKVFFIGIGGIGISALAKFAIARGMEVSGVNDEESPVTILPLQNLGAQIFFLNRSQLNATVFKKLPEADLYVYSDAWLNRGPEIIEQARASQKPVLSYFETLGLFSNEYQVIAIAGTHGKTTTTAMIANIFIDAGLDPTVVVGSFVNKFQSNFRMGHSKYLIVEADEYMRHFLNFKPKILVITNIEADHLDYYKNLEDIVSAFSDLAKQTESFVVCNFNDPVVFKIFYDLDLFKKNVKQYFLGDKKGVQFQNYKATIMDYKIYLSWLPKLNVPGKHNRMNAAAALAVANIINTPKFSKIGVARFLFNLFRPFNFMLSFFNLFGGFFAKTMKAKLSLENFSGTWRRLEKKGETKDGTIVYDDYAHHPTEIRASLQALRELYPKDQKKITVLFQPHLYSRTKILFDDFVKSFKDADQIFLLPIYAAREKPDPSISSIILANAISTRGEAARAFSDFEIAQKFINDLVFGPNDIFVTMGA